MGRPHVSGPPAAPAATCECAHRVRRRRRALPPATPPPPQPAAAVAATAPSRQRGPAEPINAAVHHTRPPPAVHTPLLRRANRPSRHPRTIFECCPPRRSARRGALQTLRPRPPPPVAANATAAAAAAPAAADAATTAAAAACTSAAAAEALPWQLQPGGSKSGLLRRSAYPLRHRCGNGHRPDGRQVRAPPRTQEGQGRHRARPHPRLRRRHSPTAR
jgi:hypothetical protein